MTATTMEARLAEIGRRVDGLYANAPRWVSGMESQLKRHIDAIRELRARRDS